MSGIKLYLWLGLAALAMITAAALRAQDTGAPTDTLAYGTRITGALNNRTPREVYYFDGARCEVVSISLKAVTGDLDPVLMILNSTGELIASRDDTSGGRDAQQQALRIPQTGRYYIVVGRFGYSQGTTAGDYELSIDRIGVSAASGCMLRYGDSVQNIITDQEPKFFYSFQANRGDIINVEMQRSSGNLDPYIQVVNSTAMVIADNDDTLDTQNARIEDLLIEEPGTYIIVASRYGQDIGASGGAFTLSLNRALNSGAGNSARAAIPLLFDEPVEGSLTDQQTARYYTFQARRNDIVTIRMERSGGRLDPYVKLTNAGLQELIADDDSGSDKNALIDAYLIPADGLYYVIATRYEGTDAIPTIGPFRLTVENLGNAFEDVEADIQRITYGVTITGNLNDDTPQILYAFWGEEGDTITVSLNRADGNLDPVVSILNSDQRPMVSDDDGGGGQNARIERFKIPESGIYYIRAMRYSGSEGPANTTGSFILVLAQIFG